MSNLLLIQEHLPPPNLGIFSNLIVLIYKEQVLWSILIEAKSFVKKLYNRR